MLFNANRRIIFDYIKKNPGKYFYNIVKDLDMSIPVVGWHLKMLEEFKCVIKEKLNGYEVYFDSSITSNNRKIYFLLSKDQPKQILDFFVKNNKGITKTELSQELNMSRNTINKYVEKLYENNILTCTTVSNKILYSLKEEYYNLILKKPRQ